jgi:hypothetical protein
MQILLLCLHPYKNRFLFVAKSGVQVWRKRKAKSNFIVASVVDAGGSAGGPGIGIVLVIFSRQ